MSVAKKIAPELPYLRRFARALCGAQESGDAYVVMTLEALIEDPGIFPVEMEPRPALYNVFLKLWSPMNGSQRPAPRAAGGASLEDNLESLSPVSRQAFLLRSVEGFNAKDTAAILDVDISTFEKLIDQAGREIAEQVATTVLIIEDEPLIALDIESLVTELGHEVTGIARTFTEAIAKVKTRAPGLVLADIQLADGSSGLDAVNEILKSIDVPVIFITAYPERLLTGSKPEPAYLITKPFQPDAVKAAISQALFLDRRAAKKAA